MRDTVRLGRFRGIAVGLNWTLLLLMALLAYGLAESRFPYDAPGYGHDAYAVAGGVAALALLAGVLAHEFAHAVIARARGMNVDGITLSWMGGVTRIRGEASSPATEFLIAVVGPLASLAFGGLAWCGHLIAAALGAGALVVSLLAWLAIINVILAVFNLLPAAPLDGGKILHSLVWAIGHKRWTATRVSSWAGIALSSVILGLGFFDVFSRADGFDGLVLLAMGMWLLMTANQEHQVGQAQHVLEGIKTADVMRPVGEAPNWLTAGQLAHDYASVWPGFVWMLSKPGGLGFSAVIPGERVAALPESGLSSMPASELATPIEAITGATPYDSVLDAIDRSDGRPVVLVIENDRTVGAVLLSDLEKVVRSRTKPRTVVPVPTGSPTG